MHMDFLTLTARMIESCEEYQEIESRSEQKIQKRHGYGKTYPPNWKSQGGTQNANNLCKMMSNLLHEQDHVSFDKSGDKKI